jgi:hypothetical protein
MDRIVECTPEGVARLYFLDLAGWVKDLHAARESVCRVLSSLLEEFSTVFPRSRLQLSPKNRPLHGPTALYWAEIAAVRVKSKSRSTSRGSMRTGPSPRPSGATGATDSWISTAVEKL